MREQLDDITRLVRACDVGELQADDDRYVNCDKLRGDNLI